MSVQAVYDRIGEMRFADADERRRVYDQLDVKVHVTASRTCPMGDVKGKLPRAERLRIEEELVLLQDYRKLQDYPQARAGEGGRPHVPAVPPHGAEG